MQLIARESRKDVRLISAVLKGYFSVQASGKKGKWCLWALGL